MSGSTFRTVGMGLCGCLGFALGCTDLSHPENETFPTSVTQAASDGWVGTWSASPQSGGNTFQQQTLRQIVHTSIAGSAARIQLSNRFGNQAVQVSNVHIAERSSGSSIVMSSDRSVTFAGQSSITIAQGEVAISDSIAFAVPALSDVAVSFYLPANTGPATYHQQGTQTNYIASGDVAGNQDLSGPQTPGSYYFLANLDVQNPSALGAVVTLGASITDGYGSSQDGNRRWPNDLAVRLGDADRTVGVLNQGISGNQLLIDGAGQSALNRFDRDVLSQPGVRWVIFSDDPINDLGNGPPTADQLIAGLSQLISRAHAAGIKFLCSTLTPFEGAGYWSSAKETGREAVDAFIRGPDSGCDGIVDQDTATHDPANPTKFLPVYDSGDHLHPNNAGLQAIADAVDLGFFTAAVVDAGSGMDSGALVDSGTNPDSGAGGASGGTGGITGTGGSNGGTGGANGGTGGSAGSTGGTPSGGAGGSHNTGGFGGASDAGGSGGNLETGGMSGNSGANGSAGNGGHTSGAGGNISNGGHAGSASDAGSTSGGQSAGGSAQDYNPKSESSGCSCHIVGAPTSSEAPSLLAAIAGLGATLIRRRTRRPRRVAI